MFPIIFWQRYCRSIGRSVALGPAQQAGPGIWGALLWLVALLPGVHAYCISLSYLVIHDHDHDYHDEVAVVVVKAQVHTIYRMHKVLMYTKCSATTGAFGMPINPLVMASLVPVWAGSWICQRPLSLRSTKAPRDVLKWDLDEPGELAVMIWKEQFLLTMFGGKACYYDAFVFWSCHSWVADCHGPDMVDGVSIVLTVLTDIFSIFST